MLAYLARRLAASLLILLGVSIVTFGLTFMIPADPVAHDRRAQRDARRCASRSATSSASTGRCRCNIVAYVGRLVQGDLGTLLCAQDAMSATLIASRLPPTLLLMLGAIIAELLIGIPAGIYAATPARPHRRQGGDDAVLRQRLDAAIRRSG